MLQVVQTFILRNHCAVSTPTLSLRERKRSETWRSLHEAALGLAFAHEELHHVTVEAIAEGADVSPRTFFNYFASKEEAILGLREPSLDDDVLASFADVSDDELLEAVARLLLDVSLGARNPGTTRQQMREVVQRHPALSQRQLSHLNQVEQTVSRVVAARLAESPRWQETLSTLEVTEAAELVVSVASTAIRFAVRHQATSHPADDYRLELEQTVSLLREVLRNI